MCPECLLQLHLHSAVPRQLTENALPFRRILKLDIEGAEKELFQSDYDAWVGRVNAIIVELHDKLRPGCSDALYRAVQRYHFTQFHRGEHVILLKQGRLA